LITVPIKGKIMLVKSLNENVKDVFLGHGWNTWVRVDLNEKRVVKSNCTLKPALVKTILSKIHK
jgi:hypothetical protein